MRPLGSVGVIDVVRCKNCTRHLYRHDDKEVVDCAIELTPDPEEVRAAHSS